MGGGGGNPHSRSYVKGQGLNQPTNQKDEINAVKSEETMQRIEIEEFLNSLFDNIPSILSSKQINYF